MKTSLVKKVIAAVLTGLFLVSTGAMAAQKCPKGEKYDEVTKSCVKEK